MIYSSPFYDNRGFLATVIRFKAQPFSLIFSLFVQLQTTGQQKNTEATFASVF